MAIGDKEEVVSGCVEAALRARGYPPPFDQNGTMAGRYNYQLETIIAFHRRVKGCLASKHYAYGYPESKDYLDQTLAMTLNQVEAAISARTGRALFSVELTTDLAPPVAVRNAKKPAKRTPAKKRAKKSTRKPVKRGAGGK
jgi:hypothetical protein